MGRRPGEERFFRALVRLFPASFREEFGDEMTSVFRDGLREAGRRRSGTLLFLWRTLSGMLVEAARERLDDLRRELRHGLRAMLKRPLLTVTAALSLGIGIGATTTVAALFNAIFIREIPGIERPERLVNVKPKKAFEESFDLISYPNYLDLREDRTALADLAGFSGLSLSLNLTRGGEPELIGSQIVTWNYFDVLGIRPRFGRFFAEEEDVGEGAHPVAVVTSRFWTERLGADPGALGRVIWLNGTPFTLIGVAPEGFRGHFVGFRFDVFLPASMRAVAGRPDRADRSASWVELVGRLNDGVSLERAKDAMKRQASLLERRHPVPNRGLEIHVEPMSGIDADLRGGLMMFLVILALTAGFVLLIACLNVSSVLLTRTVQRRRELALRLALGARGGRLGRQLMTESLLLAVLSGLLGCLLAVWATAAAGRALSAFDDRIALAVELDAPALAAALAVSFAVAIGCGAAPALRASRTDIAAVLKQASGSIVPRSRLWGTLVILQVALSLVLMVSAGLFLRAFLHAASIDPGFDPEGVTVASIDPGLAGVSASRARALLDSQLACVRDIPGTTAAGLVTRVPLGLGARFFPSPVTVGIPGWDPPPGQEGFRIDHVRATGEYLAALRIPVTEGRDFDRADVDDSRPVAVVNASLAERFFAGSSPIGFTLRIEGEEVRIVGVARDSKYRTLEEGPTPFIYLPYTREAPQRGILMARGADDPRAYSGAVRTCLRSAAAHLPVPGITSLTDRLSVSTLPQRIAGSIAGALGTIGLFLASLGLYGVVAGAVTHRSAEIGLRMSLGATPAGVVRLILRQGMSLAMIGVVLGVPAAVAISGLFGAFLVGLSAIDPFTYLATSAALLLTALVASYIPARRAARIDPLSVLKAD